MNILFYFITPWDSQFSLIDIAGISKVQITGQREIFILLKG